MFVNLKSLVPFPISETDWVMAIFRSLEDYLKIEISGVISWGFIVGWTVDSLMGTVTFE